MTNDSHLNEWFKLQTAPQLAVYNRKMEEISPYRNSPRWARERAAAQIEFEESVAEAAALYTRAMNDIELFGEITETTSYLMDQAAVGQIMLLQAAE